MQESENRSGLAGVMRVLASATVIAVSLLAVLMVLEIVSLDMFGETLRKTFYAVVIAALAAVAVGLIARIGR